MSNNISNNISTTEIGVSAEFQIKKQWYADLSISISTIGKIWRVKPDELEERLLYDTKDPTVKTHLDAPKETNLKENQGR